MATQRSKKKKPTPKTSARKKSTASKRSSAAAKKKPAAKKTVARKSVTRKATAKKAPARKPVAKRAKPQKTRDGGPVGWPSLSPYMTVRSGQASLDFYRDAFGFRSENEPMRDERGDITHAGMRLGEACIMFAPQGMGSEMRPPRDTGGIGLSLYVYVPDVDKHYKQAVAAGAQVLQVPANQFWGDRIACYVDPDGYHWTFATNLGGKSG